MRGGIVRFGMLVLVVLALLVGAGRVWAAPPAPTGTEVFSDDFSDPKKSGLEDNVNATDYSRGFHAPGVYHLIIFNNDETHMSLLPDHSYGEFTSELDVWDNSDDFTGDVSGGLVFRAQDASHMYSVLLDPRKGQYAVRKLDGSTWSDLIPWKPSSLVKQKADVNHLRVDGSGDKFTIYLNGESLDTASDSSYAKGGFGFIASNVDAPKPHFHFDNLVIYTTEVTSGQGGGEGPGESLPGAGQPDLTAPLAVLLVVASLLTLGLWMRRKSTS